MSECQFVRSQRVVLPGDMTGAEGVQGVVISITAFVAREPEYGLQWLSCSTADSNGSLIPRQGSCAESVLLAAQPPRMIPADEVESLLADVRFKTVEIVRAEYAPEIEKLQRQLKRKRR